MTTIRLRLRVVVFIFNMVIMFCDSADCWCELDIISSDSYEDMTHRNTSWIKLNDLLNDQPPSFQTFQQCLCIITLYIFSPADPHLLISHPVVHHSWKSHGFNRSPLITPWPPSQPGPSKAHSSPFAMQLCGSIIGKAKHRLNPIWRVSAWSLTETARLRLNWSSLRSGPLRLSEAAPGGDRKT